MMALNFGNSGLFNTDFEEQYKGVFENRKDETTSSGTVQSAANNLPNPAERLATFDLPIYVPPDKKVFVSFTGRLAKAASSAVVIDIRRDNSNVLQNFNWGSTASASDETIALHYLDDPGEGNYTYTVFGQCSTTTSDIVDGVYTVHLVGIK